MPVTTTWFWLQYTQHRWLHCGDPRHEGIFNNWGWIHSRPSARWRQAGKDLGIMSRVSDRYYATWERLHVGSRGSDSARRPPHTPFSG